MPDEKKFDFIVNLKTGTTEAVFYSNLNPSGYLISPDNVTKSIKPRIDNIVSGGYNLFADNAYFDIVSKLIKKYSERSDMLLSEIRKIEDKIGRRVKKGDVSDDLKKSYTFFACEVRQEAQRLMTEEGDIYARQMKIDPTHIIGCEDITMAAFIALNIEPEYTDIKRAEYKSFNLAVAKKANSNMKSIAVKYRNKYYPVASAVSYNTAFDAGITFASQNIDCVAMGFGAYMADDNYCDSITVRNKTYELPISMPGRYVRTAVVIRGFLDGYCRVVPEGSKAFHFLGLGAPIMISIVAAAFKGNTKVTYDATSPIKDAVQGTLYVSKPAHLKVETKNVVLNLAKNENVKWDCPCPFCTGFLSEHPMKYTEGADVFKTVRQDKITNAMLKPGGLLFDAYPLFSEPCKGDLRTAVDYARMGHNHWVLFEIIKSLNENPESRDSIIGLVRGIVNDYGNNTKGERFAKAISFAFGFVTAENVYSFLKKLK